ncbi:hypothetical protein F2Q68_00007372 [Brassica cretica]|uniref:F-box associated beta-propeller type 3 domain-containing protein n=1 Tax=Brassica cretica TaxID=69181 RepID=A0A8S9KVG8_BRACR|nr:hypothetical protein F2Q68_00007372 [Brassica cretica]
MVTCSKKKKLKKCRKSNSDEIPQHLVMEIIRRLPAKSVARSCSSQPRLLVCFIGRTKPCKRQYCYFFSSSSSSTTFLSRVKCPREDPECFPCLPHYANGLMRLGYGEKKLICNPSTGKSIALPKVKNMMSVSKSLFGYDPVNDEYKILCMTKKSPDGIKPHSRYEYQVLTLGADEM